jgi:FMN phosphatase YigB (HAD superfamily)
MDALLRCATARKPSRESDHLVPFEQVAGNLAARAVFGQVAHLLIDPENVLFDATLWPRWLWQVLSHMGVTTPFGDFFQPWRDRFRREVDLGQREYWEAFHEFLAHAGLSEGQIAEILAAGVCRKQRFESQRRCLTGVNETLRRLRGRGASLYVLANTPCSSEALLQELESMGLSGVFGGVLTSLELQCVMPAAKFYRRAMEQFRLDASGTAFISSRPRRLSGAKRRGIRAIAFNEEQPCRADVSLERFSDLGGLIQPLLCSKAAG